MGFFKKILIANRGEIAVRIIRTAKQMGIKTVAIYAADDQDSLHVSMADEAELLKGKSLAEKYLNQQKITQIAKKLGADAIHPGYGFLSENAGFAGRVEKSGLKFIGATSNQIELMGEKNKALDFVQKLDIPIVPRIKGSSNDIIDFAQNFSFPLLVKASSGGGGKGMLVVENLADLPSAIKQAQRQSKEYFGNDEIFVEKYLPDVRHIEVQVFGDGKGNAVHLFERECSIQRRYQKLIEEAPATSIPTELKEKLYDAALKIARTIQYKGAGTVEFLVDTEKNFYFLEMNTRLQVEHPVTEMITRIDLVEWQIRVAQGEGLPLSQAAITQRGHALELRVCAENPLENFLPTSGDIQKIRVPDSENIRFESFIKEGIQLSPNYDSLVGKMVVWDENRSAAIRKMEACSDELLLAGIKTNWAFLQQIIKNKCFINNETNTRFIENKHEQLKNDLINEREQVGKLLPVVTYVLHRFVFVETGKEGIWANFGYWRVNQELTVFVDGKSSVVSFRRKMQQVDFWVNDVAVSISEIQREANGFRFKLDNQLVQCLIFDLFNQTLIQIGGHEFEVRSNHLADQIVLKPRHQFAKSKNEFRVHADLFGKIIETNVKAGDLVEKDQILVIIESMKTEFKVLSPSTGVVKNILVEPGNVVHDKQLLIEFEVENKITINA